MLLRQRWLCLILALSGAAIAPALPRIPPNGIVNAASFTRPALPGGGIARGSIFTIFGNDFGPEGGVGVSSFPLGDVLGGVEVLVTQGEVTVNAIPVFAGFGQVNAVMPSNAPLGRVSVYVISRNRRSDPSPATVVASSFGIFTSNGSGTGPGVIQNVNTPTERPINAPRLAAEPGQIVTVWGTGLAAADFPDNDQPEQKTLPVEVEVFVGGQAVAEEDIAYAGRSSCCAGVDQIIFRVPENALRGCYVPVMIRTNQQAVSNGVTMAIADGGGQCADAANPYLETLLGEGNIGTVLLIRAELEMTVDVPEPFEMRADFAVASLRTQEPTPFPFERLTALPPPGSCMAYTAPGNVWRGGAFPFPPPAGAALDGGTELAVNGPAGRRTIPRLSNVPNHFGGLLGGRFEAGGSWALRALITPYLNEANYSISSAGGADIGALRADVATQPPIEWTNRAEVAAIDRARELTLRWSGAAPSEAVAIFGGNFDGPTDSTAGFLCLAAATTGEFSVPSWLLSTLPPSRAQAELSEAMLLLWSVPPAGAELTAEGLDAGVALGVSTTGKTVIFE